MRAIGTWLARSAAGALIVLAICASPALASGVTNPTVMGPIEGGVHGYPWNASLIPLSGPGYSYSENEYFYGGLATDLTTGAQAPYDADMVVRLPTNPEKFNGTVIVEWLNVSGASNWETVWPVAAKYLMQQGYGYVGVAAQLAGVCCGPSTLKGWDPVRYAALVDPSDTFSYDIFSHAIQALRDPNDNRAALGGVSGVDPMQGMKAKYIIGNGASQSASSLATFINDGYNRGEINAYMITRDVGKTISTFKDFSTPIFVLNEEETFGVPEMNEASQPDNPHFRVWEEAGAAHAPEGWWSYIAALEDRNVYGSGTPDPINTGCSVNRAQTDYSTRAMIYWIQQYLRTGQMPPSMPRLDRNSSGDLIRDANGMAEGGVRQPFIQVPVAYNAGTGCPLFGTYRPWTPAKIQSLYPTHADYVSDVKQAATHDVRTGWLLPQDAANAIANAEAFTQPWRFGSCYDTYNETGKENGPASSKVASALWNPELLTVGQTAPVPLGGIEAAAHEANCDVVVKEGG